MNKPKAIICDIDGVLLLSKYRNAPYQSGYQEVDAGILNELLGFSKHEVILLTARHDRMREETESQVPVGYDKLIMMEREGRKPLPKAVVYKEKKIKEIMEKYEIVVAIDDNPEIIEMYQRYKIPTLLCNFDYE